MSEPEGEMGVNEWSGEGGPMGHASDLAECLDDLGIEAIVMDDASLHISVPDWYEGGPRDAALECTEIIGDVPWSNLSENEIQVRYDWRIEQDQCVREIGIDMPPPPSFDTFRAGVAERGDTPWDVLSVASENADQETMSRAVSECPYSVEQW